ncbi:MAG: D-TA family PLP-dependent enzyme [Gemmatimonadetes bacterium]|nr:D-TA family PLP-dependent enzyme [Gemmatimonadota bacterium]
MNSASPPCTTVDQLATPAALVDLDVMHANLARVAEYATGHGLALRPHAKTHKAPGLAAEQRRLGAVGVTVATAPEAAVMAGAVDDVLVAYPPVDPGRIARLMALPPSVRLTVALDSEPALDRLSAAAAAAGRVVGVLVELDLGMHRTGVQTPADALALAHLARRLEPLEYRGVMFYPGHIRQHVDQQLADIERLGSELDGYLDALAAAQLPAQIVSGGSTPTLFHSHRLPRQTEIRPGTYIFNDRTTAAIGACAWRDCAYSVLATVISTAVPGQAVVDAGSKALNREDIRGAVDAPGYGALRDRPEVFVKAMSEEHGLLCLGGTDWQPRVGERVRIVPNHVCISVNLHPRIHGVRGDSIAHSWEVAARGWA